MKRTVDENKNFVKDPFKYKAGKVWLALKQNPDMSGREAMRKVGYKHTQNLTNIKRTDVFKHLEEKYGDILKQKISCNEVADEHIKNIVQDSDKGAKNYAIRMFKEFTEPEDLSDFKMSEVKVVFTKKQDANEGSN